MPLMMHEQVRCRLLDKWGGPSDSECIHIKKVDKIRFCLVCKTLNGGDSEEMQYMDVVDNFFDIV